MTKTNAERCESAKEKKRAKGWTRLEVWILPENTNRLRRAEKRYRSKHSD